MQSCSGGHSHLNQPRMSDIVPKNEVVCLVGDLFDILAKSSLPLFVSPKGLANLQATEHSALSALRFDHVWQRCLSADFPRLAADSSCYEHPQRHDLMNCYGLLSKVILADGDTPIIRSVTEAKLLTKTLQGIEKASTHHHDHGVPASCVLVGRFEVCEWDGDLKLEGAVTSFTLPSELHKAFGGSDTALHLQFVLAPDFILVQAGEHHVGQKQRYAQHGNIIMDIKAASVNKVLHYRQVNVQVDGRIHMATEGVHFFPEFEHGSSAGDGVEVLCALLLRAGECKNCISTLVNALQLDESRER